MQTDASIPAPASAQDVLARVQAVRTAAAVGIGLPGPQAPTTAQRLRARAGGGLAVVGDAAAKKWRSSRAPRSGSDGQLVYAVGDVHGRFDLLQTLLGNIAADAAGRPNLLIFSGDYIDRGPDSALVIERLIGLRRHLGASLFLLKGNHEAAFLRFLDSPSTGAAWIEHFGGGATLRSYGVASPEPGAPERAFVAARDELLGNMPASHLRFLQDLDLMIVLGDYAFVHAGVCVDASLAEQTEDDLLWARREFLAAERRCEKIIVHGHTWASDAPELLSHRIGLDTGAYETGVLTAVRIEGPQHRIVQALDATAEARRSNTRTAPDVPLIGLPLDYVNPAAGELAAMFSAPTVNRPKIPS
ncbi:metallophosphoesterase family protein [Phenylobacterium sp. LjRoot225]|uniref:metallophosphoesterase family protein n=1 Tax=Phenylobacterium sp. LjRoot225 TaxID=3342285 RepID=UPI003ECD52B6